jgi:pSer/pThr/pTyr-binding forkhead associated (FHA) protein
MRFSSNGTYVNKKLVGKEKKVFLSHGDLIALINPVISEKKSMLVSNSLLLVFFRGTPLNTSLSTLNPS